MTIANPASFSTGIVSAKLLMQYAKALDIGCDVLKFGNRTVEKQLAAENMSGDTVYATIADGGYVQQGDLDLENAINNGEGKVKREQVPLTVKPITGYYNLTQGDVDLLIKDSEFADRVVARMCDSVNSAAEDCITKKGTKAYAINAATDIVPMFFDALAVIEQSKIKGSVKGMGNAIALRHLASGLSGTSIGVHASANALWSGDIKNFAGLQFSKDGAVGLVKGTSFNTVNVASISADGLHITFSAAPVTGYADGTQTTPFTVGTGAHQVNLLDDLGNDTGVAASFTAHYVAAEDTAGSGKTWVLDRPYFAMATDPRKWCTDISATAANNAVTGVLTANADYYKPVLLWNENDFLVGVKGLQPLKGQDSATVPTGFSEKGILPIRGTAWGNPVKSCHNVRFDAMFGFNMYKGITGASMYIKVGV